MEYFGLSFDFSYVPALLSAVAYGFFGGLIVMLIAKKVGLMRRNNRRHSFLTKLDSLHVPITWAALLFTWRNKRRERGAAGAAAPA